ncbi:serine/threonine-protein kinase [Streptomyces sp. VMFN-G11Ma]|uniref:serine/threonine-protein kinase n=1 Tax=Streptomyces sp. VMFN-G11Ma TaxID=2135609 RepID=UPI000D3D4E42|nr:serine/threonine-protein kinase [Streptomyces sp. VMFN-G11Ma]PTM95629.1 serine/threonine protein kinase [Streptomyces sp. VMFN-G11Ma]
MGEVFAGRYELVDPIGRGGVGAVWRAWDHRRRRYVAAKVLQQSDAHSLLRFVREQALRIDHPHVLAPASWAADDDKVLFTMDLVAGGSLVHLIGDYGPLPPAYVCTLLDQLLSGLAAVHGEGVVHRDIKPANVLLEATGTARPRLRLSDFGIAMRLGEPRLTETNLVVGTPGYLAPEQMMGSEPDFPADLFAVGLVALYLLEGAKPDAKALVQYFAAHGTPSAPKSIPEPLWEVVATLLQPDPDTRFRTATGARKALAAAVELLPEPGPDDELIEVFDQLGPLPPGFGPTGPLNPAPGVAAGRQPDTSGTVTSAAPPQSVEAGAASTGSTPPRDPRTNTNTNTDTSAGTAPEPSTPTPQPSMSDTGSFQLPPPQATVSSVRTPAPRTPAPPQAPAQPHAQPHQDHHRQQQHGHVSPHDPTHVLPSSPSHAPQYSAEALNPAPHQRADASTASYTAQVPQVPLSAQGISWEPGMSQGQGIAQGQGISQETTRRNHRARPARRPGPPAKVAIPLLLLALACYAVGFWALTRI